MDADVQRIYDFVLRQEQKHLAYRWNGTSLIVYTCDNEGEWNGQLGCGSVTEVLRYADIQSKSVQIDTLDGLL